MRDQLINIKYMLVHFIPKTTFRIIDVYELRALNLNILDNLVLKLPVSQILKWIAFRRLGLFKFSNETFKFVPGAHNIKLYYPDISQIRLFDLAAFFHENKLLNFHNFVIKIMELNETFLKLQPSNHNDLILKSFSMENLNHSTSIRPIKHFNLN